jgi:hypothetical protein
MFFCRTVIVTDDLMERRAGAATWWSGRWCRGEKVDEGGGGDRIEVDGRVVGGREWHFAIGDGILGLAGIKN